MDLMTKIMHQPYEFHVYHGSSFDPERKWVAKLDCDIITEYFPTRAKAIEFAFNDAKSFLLPMRINVYPFGETWPEYFTIITRKK